MQQGIIKLRWGIMFVVFWLHISLIDLFLISSRGAQVLWQKNLTIKAMLVHLGVALLATLVIWLAFCLQLLSLRRKR